MGRFSVLAVGWGGGRSVAPAASGSHHHVCAACEHSGKRRYRDHARAQDALRAASWEGVGGNPRRHECRSYGCPTCGGGHLTSRPGVGGDAAPGHRLTERWDAPRGVPPGA